MPTEVMVANLRYDASVDEFSYGILMIHMFSRQWPEPQIGQVCTEPNDGMIPVSEAERHEEFPLAVGSDHPLMDLIRKCIHNHLKSRADANEIGRKLAKMVLQFPISFVSWLEMMKPIAADRKEKRALTKEGERKDRIIQQKDEIAFNRVELRDEKNDKLHKLSNWKWHIPLKRNSSNSNLEIWTLKAKYCMLKITYTDYHNSDNDNTIIQ